jgi:hypothetical protein
MLSTTFLFAVIKLKWQIKYTDVRGGEYKSFAGDRDIKFVNAFADPKGDYIKALLLNNKLD